MTMTGFNSIYGAYETKADRKENLISHGKKLSATMEEYDNPTFHAYQAAFKEYLRIERILAKEYGMSEEEIYMALN